MEISKGLHVPVFDLSLLAFAPRFSDIPRFNKIKSCFAPHVSSCQCANMGKAAYGQEANPRYDDTPFSSGLTSRSNLQHQSSPARAYLSSVPSPIIDRKHLLLPHQILVFQSCVSGDLAKINKYFIQHVAQQHWSTRAISSIDHLSSPWFGTPGRSATSGPASKCDEALGCSEYEGV